MKRKTTLPILLLLTAFIFKSCTSSDDSEESLIEEQKITSELSKKIITSATSLNDYNFLVSNAQQASCDFLSITSGYFNTPEGDYFPFTFSNTESLDMWFSQYNNAKLQAFNATGVTFSDEDFFITYISMPTGFGGLEKRESMLNYFENCEYGFGDSNSDFGIYFTEITSVCDNTVDDITIWISTETGVNNSFTVPNLISVKDSLASYNSQHNSNYGIESLKILTLKYITPNGDEFWLNTTKELTNYFENCMISRDDSENDCLNFVYPLEINRFSLQSKEVTTTTIQNDEDLISAFNTNDDELSFVYPINLLGANGSVVIINSNEALENALDTSATYCD